MADAPTRATDEPFLGSTPRGLTADTGRRRTGTPSHASVDHARGPDKPGSARCRGVRSSRTGASFDPLLPFETWRALGGKLGMYSNATAWWLGDWIAFGQMKYGRRYKDAIAATGLEYQTLRNYAVVARRFELSRRRDDLTFQHHAEVCALSEDDQDLWLDRAARGHWSRNDLRRRVRALNRAALSPSPMPAAVRIVVEPGRADRWRRAAQRCECELETWITQVLDDAAGDHAKPWRCDAPAEREGALASDPGGGASGTAPAPSRPAVRQPVPPAGQPRGAVHGRQPANV